MDGAECGQSLCLAASPPQDRRLGGQLIRQQLRLADRVNSEYGEEESSAESKEMGGTCAINTARRLAAPISAAVCRVIQFFVGASAPEVAVGRGLDFPRGVVGIGVFD